MSIKSFVLPAALVALAAPAVAAAPQAPGEAIRYSDLDLTTEAGQAELDRRIDSTAKAICGVDAARTGTILPSRTAQKCYEKAKVSAHRQIAERTANARQRN